MKRRSLPIRRTPIRKVRPGTRRGQATPAEVRSIREQVYERAGGRCELKLVPECIPGVLPFDGPIMGRGHLCHIGAKRRHGTTVAGSKWGCWPCHLIGLHNPKPCPPKVREE